MTIVLKLNQISRGKGLKGRAETEDGTGSRRHIFLFKTGTDWDFSKSTRSSICEKLFSKNSSALVSSRIFRDLFLNTWSQWRLWGYLSDWILSDATRFEILVYGICTVYMSVIPQPANGPAVFMTSQQLKRLVWTQHFLENSCP